MGSSLPLVMRVLGGAVMGTAAIGEAAVSGVVFYRLYVRRE